MKADLDSQLIIKLEEVVGGLVFNSMSSPKGIMCQQLGARSRLCTVLKIYQCASSVKQNSKIK